MDPVQIQSNPNLVHLDSFIWKIHLDEIYFISNPHRAGSKLIKIVNFATPTNLNVSAKKNPTFFLLDCVIAKGVNVYCDFGL